MCHLLLSFLWGNQREGGSRSNAQHLPALSHFRNQNSASASQVGCGGPGSRMGKAYPGRGRVFLLQKTEIKGSGTTLLSLALPVELGPAATGMSLSQTH